MQEKIMPKAKNEEAKHVAALEKMYSVISDPESIWSRFSSATRPNEADAYDSDKFLKSYEEHIPKYQKIVTAAAKRFQNKK